MAEWRVLLISLCIMEIYGHIPIRYDWAEPNAPQTFPDTKRNLDKRSTADRVGELRRLLANQEPPLHAYLIPTADAHNSQYIAPTDARREWISSFTGSAGTALVTSQHALLWTDGRYFTQFDMEVDETVWTLMRQGTDLTIQDWLAANLDSGSVLGIDPTTYTRTAWNSLQATLSQFGITIRPTALNLVDEARRNLNDPPPPRANNDLIALPLEFTGRQAFLKIAELKRQMYERNASVLILTALDDVAYTLNLRGTDIPFNPVFFAYLVITLDLESEAILFWGNGILDNEIIEHLGIEGMLLETRPYGEVFQYLEQMATELPEGSTVWLSQDASEAIHLAVAGPTGSQSSIRTISSVSPVALIKCIKNDVELRGFRNAHIKDGIAVVRFLRWIHEQVDSGNRVTEMDASDQLEKLRGEELDFAGPSFATIAGAGPNGAVIHYRPSRDPETEITSEDMFLVDSGGQYRDGTTDITRTRHMNYTPTAQQKLTFTRVLKGQILMGTAVFPRGSRGHVLDTLARKALWDVGLDYAHGTGHGVGHFLNVHEGPSGIGSGAVATDPGIQPGMIFSNEPGYYEVNEYGIRHEDLVEVIEVNSEADHIFAKSIVGDFSGRGAVGFNTISLVPHQAVCIDVDLLTDHELDYLNDYHARVLNTLGPILRTRGWNEDLEFLERECSRLTRNSAFRSTLLGPVWILLSIFTLLRNY